MRYWPARAGRRGRCRCGVLVGTMFPTDWLPVILEASAIGGGLLFYVKNRQARDRLRNVRYANMLMNELEETQRTIERIARNGYGDGLEPLPGNVYDGLVLSTNFSYFDGSLQNHLHKVYGHIGDYNERVFRDRDAYHQRGQSLPPDHMLDGLKAPVKEAIALVKAFRARNKPTRWLRLLKALHWYYDD